MIYFLEKRDTLIYFLEAHVVHSRLGFFSLFQKATLIFNFESSCQTHSCLGRCFIFFHLAGTSSTVTLAHTVTLPSFSSTDFFFFSFAGKWIISFRKGVQGNVLAGSVIAQDQIHFIFHEAAHVALTSLEKKRENGTFFWRGSGAFIFQFHFDWLGCFFYAYIMCFWRSGDI